MRLGKAFSRDAALTIPDGFQQVVPPPGQVSLESPPRRLAEADLKENRYRSLVEWRLPSGSTLAEFALQSGFVASGLWAATNRSSTNRRDHVAVAHAVPPVSSHAAGSAASKVKL